MPLNFELGIAILISLDLIPIGIGIIVYYFMRRYMRKKLQRKDLGLKNDLIRIAISLLSVIIGYAVLNILSIPIGNFVTSATYSTS